MKDFIFKYFGRILAILGCSTLVTACYGVPYSKYELSGRVVDADTDQPLKDIKVRVTPCEGNYKKYPYDSSVSTDSDGSFELSFVEEDSPYGYIVECQDIDGDSNGSYKSVTKEIPYEQSYDVVIEMTPEHR